MKIFWLLIFIVTGIVAYTWLFESDHDKAQYEAWNVCKRISRLATGEQLRFRRGAPDPGDNLAPKDSGKFRYVWDKEYTTMLSGESVRIECIGTLYPFDIISVEIDGKFVKFTD